MYRYTYDQILQDNTCGWAVLPVGQPRPRTGRCPSAPQFLGIPFYFRTTEFRRGHITCGEGHLGISHAHPKGAGPTDPRFWGFMHAYTLCRRTTKFLTWEERVSWVSHAATPHIPRERSYGSSIIEVLLYLCLHPLTQNDQMRHGNSYREG